MSRCTLTVMAIITIIIWTIAISLMTLSAFNLLRFFAPSESQLRIQQLLEKSPYRAVQNHRTYYIHPSPRDHCSSDRINHLTIKMNSDTIELNIYPYHAE